MPQGDSGAPHEPLHLGILGAASIAIGGIIPAASRTDNVEVAAVATRGGKKSREAGEAAPEAELFEDYDSLLEKANIEAVYIPLPNSMHVEWALKAIEAGKHILCEKPFALDGEEAAGAVEAAERSGLTLMEGFMFRLHPQTQRLGELLSGGALGRVRQVVAEFGHRLDDPADVRGIGSLGGGSLGDVGCYCISAIRASFGSEPSGPRPSPRSTRRERTGSWPAFWSSKRGSGLSRRASPRRGGSGWRSSARRAGSPSTLPSARTRPAGRWR